MLAFDPFAQRFAEEFAPDVDFRVLAASGLFDDLGLDSFAAFRMILFLEELADVPFPPDDIPPMFTVGDAYDYYCSLCAAHERLL
jgi:acyl carrier protein